VQKYLYQRRRELNAKLNSKCEVVFNQGYDFIDVVIISKFTEVAPEVSRKIELLEALLFAFIEHGLNLDLLNDIEQHIQDVHLRGVSERVIQ